MTGDPTDTATGGAPNAQMAELWNGPTGAHWADHADRHDRLLGPWGEAVLAAAALTRGDRVLDVGCGTGTMTRSAARSAPDGHALGVDISGPLVALARDMAAADGPGNVAFEVADAQVHPFAPGSADVVLSRFGVMFFDDLVAAFANIRRALASGGRLAFVCWQDLALNDWSRIPWSAVAEHVGMPDRFSAGRPGPYSLADPDRVREVLGAAGYDGVALDPVAGTMRLGESAADAYDYMRRQPTAEAMFEGRDPERVARGLAALRATLDGVAGPDGVELPASAWIVTARSG
jgi:SAM-dependent methyltransferase